MSRRYRVLSALSGLVLSACAAEPAPVARYSGDSESIALREARAIEAARRHPNAQPRIRPEYPEQAPPPLPPGTSPPAPLYLSRRSAPYTDYPATSSVMVEREVYRDAPYSYGSRYGLGLSYGYGYPYGGSYWDPYGYRASGYRYGYGLGGYGLGHASGFQLGGTRYHSSPGFGHSLHIRSVGGGFRHHR